MTKKIKESTVAGSVAVVPAPLGNMQTRAGSMFKGKKTKKKFYESPQFTSRQQVIDYFVTRGKTEKQGAAAWERGYRGPKKATPTPPSHWLDREDQKPVNEQELQEQDVIIVPGQGHRLKPGLLPKHNRTDHEVEMAKSDLFQAAKNATEIYKIIRDVPETQGLEGWVQEKIIKANDYLNSVREYLQHRDFDQKMPIDEEASIRQKLKTMLRNMDPTILDRVGSEGIDKVQYGWDLEDQKNLSPEDAKRASKNIRQGNRLRRLAHGENPFTGQPKQMEEMTGGVLAGGMSNFEEGVAEGSEYTPPKEGTVKASIMKNAATPTVQVKVFKHNTLRGDSYWVTKEVKRFKTMDQARAYIDRINKQGVAEGSEQDFKRGNKVRFKNRTQPAQYMTITDIDRNMFDTKIKLDLVSGWWNPGSLVHYEKQGVAEGQVDEEKDACYNKVKRRYKVWPSAYASGALVKCRKVGASNWGNKSKK